MQRARDPDERHHLRVVRRDRAFGDGDHRGVAVDGQCETACS